MWQRFTERARKAVFYAQEEAQKGEGYVSTEHLLLGLCREHDTVASKVFLRLNVSIERVRAEVEKQLPRNTKKHFEDMPLAPRAKRVIDLAYHEARELGNEYIRTEHLLLGLVREHDGLAGRVLAKLGVEIERTRQEVRWLHNESAQRKAEEIWSNPPPRAQSSDPYAFLLGSRLCEHILLAAIASEDTVAGKAIRLLVEDVAGLQGAIWQSMRAQSRRGIAPIYPEELERLLEAAHEEAEAMGEEKLTPYHLAIAATRRNRQIMDVLAQFGLREKNFRAAVIAVLEHEQEKQAPSEPPDPSPE